MKIHDPKSIFSAAEIFRMAAWALDQFNHQTMGSAPPGTSMTIPVVPLIVNAAFAFELYLKCVIAIDGKSNQGQHNHRKLFDIISKDKQDAIRKLFYANAPNERLLNEAMAQVFPGQSQDFDTLLDSSQDAFQKFRYFYENPDSVGAWMSGPISDAVRTYIITAHSHLLK